MRTPILFSWSAYTLSILLLGVAACSKSAVTAGPGVKLWKLSTLDHHTDLRERCLLHVNPPHGETAMLHREGPGFINM